MVHAFDPGYGSEPFLTLCREYPGEPDYVFERFRVEWGPVFHRGRLDGSARVLVIGQDPAQHENVVRRILVGEAGKRVQGFLAKLGIVKSYVMVNTFLYSVYGSAGPKFARAEGIASYRNRWINALLTSGKIEAVVALGTLFRKIIHPTQPESAAKSGGKTVQQLTQAMLKNWNEALKGLRPAVLHPDTDLIVQLYGDAFLPEEKPSIPDYDLPAGLPAWMWERDGWARRIGAGDKAKRANITITIPKEFQTW